LNCFSCENFEEEEEATGFFEKKEDEEEEGEEEVPRPFVRIDLASIIGIDPSTSALFAIACSILSRRSERACRKSVCFDDSIIF
jgi:hypothetical protein